MFPQTLRRRLKALVGGWRGVGGPRQRLEHVPPSSVASDAAHELDTVGEETRESASKSGGREEEGDSALEELARVPESKEEDDSGEQSGLSGSKEKTADDETGVRLDETH